MKGPKEGDIVYTRTIRTGAPHSNQPQSFIEYKSGKDSYYISLLIGQQRKAEGPLTNTGIYLLLANIGLFAGDDLVECFGEESFKKLEKFILKKYHDENQDELEEE